MEANKRQISDIFNGDRILQIPFFQRAYVWGEIQLQRFLDDLEYISTSSKPYFFGSLIFKQHETPTDNNVGDVRTVVDGQQRLTTLVIFFKVLSIKLQNNKLFTRFLLGDSSIALSHNHNDKDAFEKICNLKNLEDAEKFSDKNSNVVKAYNFFKDHINPERINEAKIRQNSVFVVIDLSADEDEQKIFDTLNSLGVQLTTAELLKNYLFSRSDFEIYKTHWRTVFEKDDDTKKYWDRAFFAGRINRTFIDLFFYAYLQIKVQDMGDKVAAKDREEFSRLEYLFASYKKLMEDYKIDRNLLLREIKDYAENFRNHINNEVVEEGLLPTPSIQRVNAIIFGLDTTPLIPYILFVINNTDSETQKEIFACVEAFVLRRLVVRANTRGHNQLFLRMIGDRVLTKKAFYAFVNNLTGTGNAMPNDEELKKGFHESKLVNKIAKGVLYFIESRLRDEKHATNLLGMNKYSLEHLMPKKWQNNWGKLDSQQAIDERNQKLLTLGNLAIITQKLNASIRDSAWKIKLEGKGNRGGLKQYAAGIEIHKFFLETSQWDEKKINSRGNALLKNAQRIWQCE